LSKILFIIDKTITMCYTTRYQRKSWT